jgi:carbonic anhydrase
MNSSLLRLICIAAWIAVIPALAGGCRSGKAKVTASRSTSTPLWSYTGDTGPDRWGSLSPEYRLCAAGKKQSPIDIAGTVDADLPNVAIKYYPAAVDIINNGNAVQVNYPSGSFITIGSTRYNLLQFHFHSPSEHTINGQHADAEMHLVHQSKAGQLAVISVMLNEGEHNPEFDPVWSHLPQKPGKAVRHNDVVDARKLLPADARSYRYEGSLTTPPGTEGVSWFIMTEPVAISADQLAEFRRIYSGNNRPTQSRNGRIVQRDTSE